MFVAGEKMATPTFSLQSRPDGIRIASSPSFSCELRLFQAVVLEKLGLDDDA
jgi:hypothetical protein